MEPTLPQKTADYTTLPDGTRLLVKCLTELLRAEAEEKASRHARRECVTLLKGGEDYADTLSDIRAHAPEQQAAFLADGKLYAVWEEARKRFPETVEPERKEGQTELQHAEDCAKWETDAKQAEEKRREFVETRHQEEREKALALKPAARLKAAYELYYAQAWAKAYTARLELETLLRAVRHADEPLRRFFASVEEIQDFDDAPRRALLETYEALCVEPGAVPTSPNASAG